MYKPLREQFGNRKKVAIVGFCNPHREWAPYDNPDFEIWGLNRGYIFMPRADRWFEMHGRHIFTLQDRRPGNHVDYLHNFPGPIYMHQSEPEVPNSIALPLEELANMLGPWFWRVFQPDRYGAMTTKSTEDEPYLSSSIAFEIALAIYEGFEEIHLFGIDLNTDSEYAWQKPGVEFLIGFAGGRGQKVFIPEGCPLLKGTLYGRGYLSPQGEQISMEQLQTRMKALQAEQDAIQRELNQVLGAHRELTQYVQAQMVPGIDHEKTDQRRQEMEKVIGNLQTRLAQTLGAIKETAYWIHQTPDGQTPKEAIEQLRAGRLDVDEGPIMPTDVLMFSENGYKPEPVEVETVALP